MIMAGASLAQHGQSPNCMILITLVEKKPPVRSLGASRMTSKSTLHLFLFLFLLRPLARRLFCLQAILLTEFSLHLGDSTLSRLQSIHQGIPNLVILRHFPFVEATAPLWKTVQCCRLAERCPYLLELVLDATPLRGVALVHVVGKVPRHSMTFEITVLDPGELQSSAESTRVHIFPSVVLRCHIATVAGEYTLLSLDLEFIVQFRIESEVELRQVTQWQSIIVL